MNGAVLDLVLFGFLVFEEVLHFFEKRELENKLMAKDYGEYVKIKRDGGKKDKKPYKTEYEKIEEDWNSGAIHNE